jgi:aspartate 1-decarboxylase
LRTYVAAKIHGLRVTAASVDYNGSVTVDQALLDAADIEPYEQVDIVNLSNGNRWTTYVLPGPAWSFTLNGGGARLGVVGDRCVLMTYRTEDKFSGARVIFVSDNNDVRFRSAYP